MRYNILVINWQDIANPFSGGAEVHLHEIFKRIVEKGHRVTLLCCTFNGGNSKEMIDGIKIVRRGRGRNHFNCCVPFAYFNLTRKYRYDIVIDDLNKIPFYTPLYVKEPLIGIVHHLFSSTIFLETTLHFALYVYITERFIPSVYKKMPMMTVSKSTKEELVRRGMDSRQIEIIHNGVDRNIYKCFKKKKSQNPLLGYLGRLKKYKSIEHIIFAMAKVLHEFPQAKLIIIGDGDYSQSLMKLVSKLNLTDHVQFTGAITQEKKVAYLNQMWLTVNPSPKEGWGITVMEANACGTPVVAANSPGLCESVIHGETGFLYPYGNIEKLAKSILRLLTNPDLIERLSRNSIKWAERFTWENSANKTLNLITNVINQGKYKRIS